MSVLEVGVVRVRFWAAARAAVGHPGEDVDVEDAACLADLLAVLARRHPGAGPVLAHCSVLVGERPVSAEDPATVSLSAGDCVEFLPPFAGG